MTALAHFFLDINRPAPDYLQRYRQIVEVDSSAQKQVLSRPSTQAPPERMVEAIPAAAAQVVCPKCNAPMVLRTAAKGANAGNAFYGCSRFPKCRGVLNSSGTSD